MTDTQSPLVLLTQDQAAKVLALKNPKTLAAWRLRRQGPAYCFVGRHVRYRQSDLESWLLSGRVDHPKAV